MMSRPNIGRCLTMPLRGGQLAIAVVAMVVITATAGAQVPAGSDWITPERRARRANPVPISKESVARGLEVYRRECFSCHGKGGRGDGSKAGELNTKPSDLMASPVQSQSDGALFWKITEGRGDMPSNRTALTEEERWCVVNYIRSLAAKAEERAALVPLAY